MDAFANYRPLDYEHIALNPLIQKAKIKDIRIFPPDLPLQFEQSALKPLIRKITNMDLSNSSSQISVWDKAAAASSSGSSGSSDWTNWSVLETPDLREQINHHFVEFTDPLEFPSYARSSVVYPYVPIDHRRSLEENLLVAWYTSSMPTKIVHTAPRPEEAQGYNPSFLAQKAKLCSSDWLDYINAFVLSAPVSSPETEASTSSSSSPEVVVCTPSPPTILSWTEKLKIALSMEKVFSPYKPPPPPTSAERKQALLLLAAFSHLPFNVLEDEVPLTNLQWNFTCF
ncbi:unnamed protein product [Camellia sinensis]